MSSHTEAWARKQPISPMSPSHGWIEPNERSLGGPKCKDLKILSLKEKRFNLSRHSHSPEASESSSDDTFADSDTDSETHRAAAAAPRLGCYSADQEVFIIAGSDIPLYSESLNENNN